MKYKITQETNPRHDDVQVLGDGIMAFASQKRGHKPIGFFAFFIRDENDQICGGCSCCNLYGCLYVDQLWMEEALRGKGYGTQLMIAAEKLGRELGCTFSAVNTMDWEALGFYKKLGYQVELERRGFLKNSIFYFLRKDISENIGNNFEMLPLQEKDIAEIVLAFKNIGWNKPSTLYESYLLDQKQNQRTVLVAKIDGQFCGYVTIKWKSGYQNFVGNNIPEISDLNVLPNCRKKGVGTALIKECERMARNADYSKIGLGVGLTKDYGNAQRLYFQLGYMPDGNGLHHNYKMVNYAETVTVDDDLVIFMSKQI